MSVIPSVLRASFANLSEPKAISAGGDEKYSLCIMIRKDDKAALDYIETQINAAKEKGKDKKWKGVVPKNLKSILRDGDDEQVEEGGRKGPEFKDHFFFNAYAQVDQQPGTVKIEGGRVVTVDPNEIYSGCYVRVDVNFYPYAGVSNGIAAALNNVLFVKDGERLDGRVSAETAFADLISSGEEDDSDSVSEGGLM